jgi:hypothetical protein
VHAEPLGLRGAQVANLWYRVFAWLFQLFTLLCFKRPLCIAFSANEHEMVCLLHGSYIPPVFLYCTAPSVCSMDLAFCILYEFLPLQLRVEFHFGSVGFGRTCTAPVCMICEGESNENLDYVLCRNLLNRKGTQ